MRAARPTVRRVLRLLGALALGAVVLLVAYVIAGNAVVRTGALARMVDAATPDGAVRLHYGRAWTFWPGTVKVSDLRVEYRHPRHTVTVRADDATFDFDLLPLLVGRVDLSLARAGGLRVSVRSRAAAPAPRPVARAAPRMAGVGDRSGLRLRVNHLDTDLRALEVDDYGFEGDARVQADLDLEDGHRLTLRALKLQVASGRVVLGPHDLAASLEGTLDARAAALDLTDPEALARHLDAAATFEAVVHDGGYFEAYLEGLRFRGGEGTLLVDAAIRAGRVVPGSTARYLTPHLTLEAGGLRATAGADVRYRADAEPQQGVLDVRAVGLQAGPAGGRVVGGPPDAEIHLRLRVPTLALRPSAPSIELRVNRVRLDQLSPVSTWLERQGRRWPITGGTASTTAYADSRRARLVDGWLHASAEGMTVVGPVPARLDADVAAALEDAGPEEVRLERVQVVLRDVRPTGTDEVAQIRLIAPWVVLAGEHLEAAIKVEADGLAAVLERVPGFDALTGAIPALLSSERVTARLHLESSGDEVRLRLDEAASGDWRAQGAWHHADGRIEGAARVEAGLVPIGVEWKDGRVQVRPLATEGWLEEATPTD